MALVRILVDGYSLLHAWKEIAPGKPRHSAAARDELVNHLKQYQDAAQIPVTIVFDGSGPLRPTDIPSTPELEVLYSRDGQTADQIIERVAYRMRDFGEVLAVTNDRAERDTVISSGGTAVSCEIFLQMFEEALSERARSIKHHNLKENTRYKNPK